MRLLSATTRITLGLVCLSLSIWIGALTLGLIPNDREAIIAGRIALSEHAAVQTSMMASRNDVEAIETGLKMLVSRNPSVLSAAVRRADGSIVAQAGDHGGKWTLPKTNRSTASQMYVPIRAGDVDWGSLEVRYSELRVAGLRGWLNHPVSGLLAFNLVVSFLLYYLYLRKTLNRLDPSSAVPPRVRTALDTFAEGVLILDDKERILLANRAISEATKLPSTELVGRKASDLAWTNDGDSESLEFPWTQAMREGAAQVGRMLSTGSENNVRFFRVNACPVMGEDGNQRGVLVSFDDITALETKKTELMNTLEQLQESQAKIREQTRELQLMATIDSLTGCMNRRAFFEEFDKHWKSASRYDQHLSCVMVDIDHFKSINDSFGHSVGDEVLRKLAAALQDAIRDCDVVCRYGGEEFCVLLPHLGIAHSTLAAERFRRVIAGLQLPEVSVTASLGVSSFELGAKSVQDLLDQADKALYAAKRGGRNRVVRWDRWEPAPVIAKTAGPAPVSRQPASTAPAIEIETAEPVEHSSGAFSS